MAAARFLLFGLTLAFAACTSGTGADPLVPSVPVNEQLNVLNQQYQALRADNGVVAIKGGVKGILVVRVNAATYLAFERNCPYRPYDACSTVSLDRNSRLFLRDSCCTSQFSLQGQVTGGPAGRNLRQYSTNLNGSILSITN